MSSEPSEPPLASPCRRQCCLDDADICIGCGPTLQDILDWGAASHARRVQICQQARERQLRRGNLPAGG